MRLAIQRVTSAAVTVLGQTVGALSTPGLLVFVGLGHGDEPQTRSVAIEKLRHLRIFSNQDGRFDSSLEDVQGGLLLVSQFTLYADTSKGRRPDFFGAMSPDAAKEYFEALVQEASEMLGRERVASGTFGAHMQVELCNDGPVTIWMEL